MSDCDKLVKALRCKSLSKECDSCGYGYHLSPDSECNDACQVEQIYADAAAAIEELQAEVDNLKRTDAKRCQECLYLGQPVGEQLLPKRGEIVRCRECRWGIMCVTGQHLGLDGFCSKGERKVQDERTD